LLKQARWLMLAKDRRTASSVLAVRDAVDAGDSENPFVRKLAWRSLLTAAADRAMRYALKSINNQDDLSPEGRTPPSA
jgi:hypothetical protein